MRASFWGAVAFLVLCEEGSFRSKIYGGVRSTDRELVKVAAILSGMHCKPKTVLDNFFWLELSSSLAMCTDVQGLTLRVALIAQLY